MAEAMGAGDTFCIEWLRDVGGDRLLSCSLPLAPHMQRQGRTNHP